MDTDFIDYSNAVTTSKSKWSQEQMMLVKKELGMRLLEQIAGVIEKQKCLFNNISIPDLIHNSLKKSVGIGRMI